MEIKLALLADLHLPFLDNTTQYKAFDFAMKSIKKNQPDAIVSLGDMTACGDMNAAEFFVERIEKLGLPKLMVLGNSDIRTEENIDKIRILESHYELSLENWRLLGLNSSNSRLSNKDKSLLNTIDEKTIVFLHHPPQHLCKESREYMEQCLAANRYKACVYGHLHFFSDDGNSMYCIQSLDPDKAIGEPPCITYMIVNDHEIRFEYDFYPCKQPEDFGEYIGLSCFNWDKDITFAAEHHIRNIELRPGVIRCDLGLLKHKVEQWRNECGTYLSLHMPDYSYNEGIKEAEEWKQAILFANELKVDGVTIHVPKVSVSEMKRHTGSIIVDFIVSMIRRLPQNVVVGIENMHMTSGEKPDENRRYGYCPEECVEFVNRINEVFGYERVGLLLDVGHARNNAPYSQKYNLSSWYSLIGNHTVGYHIHQVLLKPNGMENHAPITNIYGPLISYCSFLDCWNRGILNKRPVFLEIRGGEEKYCQSLNTFSII